MFNANSPSLADIAAVTKDNDGFGGGNGWWILIILFAIFGGWGNRGYESGAGGYATASDVQRGFDTQEVITKLNGLENGMASLGYDQLAQMNGINTNIMTVGNSLQAKLAECCCNNREAIAQVRYDMATNTCAIKNDINQMGQQIMQNDNANYRQLHDEIVALQMEAKNEQIANMRTQINNLEWRASQNDQTCAIINQLRPAPVPAYTVANPYAYNGCGCNVNNGCGC